MARPRRLTLVKHNSKHMDRTGAAIFDPWVAKN